jgi:L-ascorbate metabolism protein UlaG (beta-lactamase superfamily)
VRITYVGHATLLLEIGDAKVLTDPNFDATLGALLPRVTPPGIPIEEMPPLDVMLLTHAHADHLSFRSLKKLPRSMPLLAPPTVAEWLSRKGYANATPLAPGESFTLRGGELRIHAGRATHRGNRYGFDRWRSETNMYLLESHTESAFFAGDTALTDTTHHLVKEVLWSLGRRLDVALLPIGYAPRWKPGFRRGHLTSADALALFEVLNARAMLPYHWGTFRHVTATAYDAINRLRIELEEFVRREHVHIIEPGETLVIDGEDIRQAGT